MNPVDSNVEPVGAVRSQRLRTAEVARRAGIEGDQFLAWLNQKTIEITSKHFGVDPVHPRPSQVFHLSEFRYLAETA